MLLFPGHRRTLLAVVAFVIAGILMPMLGVSGNAGRSADLLVIDGPIGPATSDFVVRNIENAEDRNASVIVLRINTPGGLDTSMREIIQAVLSSKVPVIGYVAPSGARAASAGTYILLATHLAVMAPATNVGAATPVAIGGLPMPGVEPAKDDADSEKEAESPHPTMGDKVVRDAVAYIRGLAQLHGRNAEWAEKAVTEAASLSATEALAEGVIDLIAHDLESLLAQAEGRTVKVMGEERVLHTAGLSVFTAVPDWRTEFLEVITNPNVAYILLLLGIYGLVFEFWNPGFTGPGVIGAICLMVALFALHLLPVNYAGLGLIALGIAFMVAETFVPAFGILGIGGVVAFVVGSVMLMDTKAPGFEISWVPIASVGGASAILFLGTMMMFARSRRRPVVSGQEEMIGLEAEVIRWSGTEGTVRAHSEMWKAASTTALEPGQRVRVRKMDGLVLIVEPQAEDKEE